MKQQFCKMGISCEKLQNGDLVAFLWEMNAGRGHFLYVLFWTYAVGVAQREI